MNIYDFHNEYHLGDCTFHLNYLRLISCLYPDQYYFNFYVDFKYYQELSYQIQGFNNIQILPIDSRPDNSINCWIGYDDFYYCYINHSEVNYLDMFYVDYFRDLSIRVGLPIVYLTVKDFLYNHDFIYTKTLPGDYDLLFINSVPLSFQYDYDQNVMDNFIRNLNSKMKIITTCKVDGFECTLDYGYNITEIGILSKNVKNIIAVNTSPVIPCLNHLTLSTVDRFIILDVLNTYSFSKIERHSDIRNVRI